MRIKQGLIIEKLDEEFVLVDSGIESPKFNGMIKLNQTSKAIVDLLIKEELSFDELISKLLDIYNVDEETLTKSVKPVLEQLKKVNILRE